MHEHNIYGPANRFRLMIRAVLIVTRAAGESVWIGDDLLTVLRVRPWVRLQFVVQGSTRLYDFDGGKYKADESMVVGQCRVVLMEVGPREVTLGFDAPRSVPIVRTELMPARNTSKTSPDQR